MPLTPSDQQRAIFGWFKSPPRQHLVVTARAGSGKTTTILEAVRRIEQRPGLSVLVCAFNKRIGDELKRKLEGANATAKTFHALGLSFLRNAWGHVDMNRDIEDERIETALDGREMPWDTLIVLRKLISVAKGVCPRGDADAIAEIAPAYNCLPPNDEWGIEELAAVARTVMDLSREQDPGGRITFDDMLFVPVVNEYILPLYDWVVVDEAQDTNPAQLELAMKSCKPDGHIVVVGDDRQAIYGFRGADSGALGRLKTQLDADELKLTTTYRCPTSVVREAQRLVPDIEAWADALPGEVVPLHPDDVVDLVDPMDVILSRTNAPLVPLCLRILRRGVPAKIEGRDIGKLLLDRAKKMKATTVPQFLERLGKWATRATGQALAYGKNVQQKLLQILDVQETLVALCEDCETMEQVYRRCDQLFGDDVMQGKRMVTLSTVHKAKGLEWPVVFVLCDTLYVYGKRPDDREEANIHYVAVTRAQQRLVLVSKSVEEESHAASL